MYRVIARAVDADVAADVEDLLSAVSSGVGVVGLVHQVAHLDAHSSECVLHGVVVANWVTEGGHV